MPVDRKLFTQPILEKEAPRWICPTCGAGHLRLVPEAMHKAYSAETEQTRNEVWFEASHVEYRFSGLLKCENPRCGESASVCGRGTVMEYPDERMERMEYEDRFFPTYVRPSPRLVTIPAGCPDKVRDELQAAFVASWGDPSSAGNHVRGAVELLLDALHVRKTRAQGKSKRQRVPLHSRIESLKAKNQVVYDSLLAIKWLGNAGSHAGPLTREAVFDAFDIFEAVLEELFSDRKKQLGRLVAEINKRRGPTKKR